MLKTEKIFTQTLVAVGLAGALVFGTCNTAHAAFGFGSINETETDPAVSTVSITAEEKLGLNGGDELSSEDLLTAVGRTAPAYTVKQADRIEKRASTLKGQLESGKAVDVSAYLKTLGDDVEWMTCGASHYGIGDGLLGSSCSDGSKVTLKSMGVAHKTLSLGTKIQIMYNGKVVNATVVDRGPYVAGRDLDLQPAVATALGFDGVGTVQYRVL